MTGLQVVRTTALFLLTLACAYILVLSYQVLIGLLIAILIASALRPLVVRLQKWRIPQGIAVLLVYGLLGITSVLAIGAVMPPVINQFAGYLQNENRLANRLVIAQNYVEQQLTQVTGSEVDFGLAPDDIREAVADVVSQIRRTAPDLVNDVGAFMSDFILILVMGIYWMASRDRGLQYITQFVSLGRREKVRLIIDEIELGMGAYMRGLFLISLLVGILCFAALVILRVPNAAALSFFYAVATAIPIIGGLVGVAIATALALLSSPIHAVAVLIVTVLIQQVENYVLTPRMMSSSVDLDPILVIVFVSVGFALSGITGALLAIPVAGTVAILLRHLILEPRKDKVIPGHIDGGVLLVSTPDAEREG